MILFKKASKFFVLFKICSIGAYPYKTVSDVPADYNPHIGLATIDHAGPFAGIGSVHTSPI